MGEEEDNRNSFVYYVYRFIPIITSLLYPVFVETNCFPVSVHTKRIQIKFVSCSSTERKEVCSISWRLSLATQIIVMLLCVCVAPRRTFFMGFSMQMLVCVTERMGKHNIQEAQQL